MTHERSNPRTERDLESVDAEHRLQIELLDALIAAAQSGRGDDHVDELLQRLRDVSEAHFLSEDLLMRLHAYPEHAEHVAEHEEMTSILDSLREAISSPDVGRISALRQRLVHHILDKDERLERFLEEPGRNDGLSTPDIV
jgi:hemerythrin